MRYERLARLFASFAPQSSSRSGSQHTLPIERSGESLAASVAADVPGGDDARACSELVREVGADESPLARVLGAVVGPRGGKGRRPPGTDRRGCGALMSSSSVVRAALIHAGGMAARHCSRALVRRTTGLARR